MYLLASSCPLFSPQVKTQQMIIGFYEILHQKCSLKFFSTWGKGEGYSRDDLLAVLLVSLK